MASAVLTEEDLDGAVGLYLDLKPNELVDLEVAAMAAIEWARGLKAAAVALDHSYDYRVSLIAAEPGSSRWMAKVERSKANQLAKDVKQGWEKVPLILRLTIGLAVVIPVTLKPTWDYWMGEEGFTEQQKQELREMLNEASQAPQVQAHRQSMYRQFQRDPTITSVGGGVPTSPEWRPDRTVPADQFAEGDGLFEPRREEDEERIVPQELDVILVTPRLENAPRAWTFRQEGIPGTFNAIMKDKRFLAALDRSAVRETFRSNIPMRIRLSIKQQKVDGEWRVARQGRVVTEVISPRVD
jgi:hypothetical protein